MIRKILTTVLVITSFAFANSQVEININNNTIEFIGDLYLNDTYNVSNDANYYFTASYLKSEDIDQDSEQYITSVGLNILNPFTNDSGLSFGLGIKALLANSKSVDKTFTALPLGLFVKYEYNDQLSTDLQLNYAPKTLSFADAETYRSGKLKINYKVLENGYVFVGFRKIRTEYVNAKVDYDDNLFFGYKVQF